MTVTTRTEQPTNQIPEGRGPRLPAEVRDAGERTLARFEGRQILDPDGVILAELAADDSWYTSDGVPCTGLVIPAPRAQPHVACADRDAARHAADRAWMTGAVDAITALVSTRHTITCDDVWAAIPMPPREARMIGNALARARGLGLIEPTEEHRRSERRDHNHARPVRVWRSLRYGQQPLS
jgi:hypothetical protein